MTVDQLELLFAAFAEASILGGFGGAMLYMLLRGLCISLWRMVEESQWWNDWHDRRYVRWLNRDTARQLRGARQTGRISPQALLAVAVVALAFLSACASPEPAFNGSQAWWDTVKARSW